MKEPIDASALDWRWTLIKKSGLVYCEGLITHPRTFEQTQASVFTNHWETFYKVSERQFAFCENVIKPWREEIAAGGEVIPLKWPKK